MSTLVAATQRALEPHLAAPFAFFGHSLGAIVALEITRCLQMQGFRPKALFLSSPTLRRPPGPLLHQLDDDALIACLAERHWLDPATLASPELLAWSLPYLRADLEVAETHVPARAEPIDVPLAVFGGDADPSVPSSELACWATETTAAFSVHVLPGNHFYLRDSRSSLLEHLEALLAR